MKLAVLSKCAPGTTPGTKLKKQTNDNTMNKTYYLGLDVHSEKNAIAHALEGSREEVTYYGSCGASVPNTEVTLRRLAKKLGVNFKNSKCATRPDPPASCWPGVSSTSDWNVS